MTYDIQGSPTQTNVDELNAYLMRTSGKPYSKGMRFGTSAPQVKLPPKQLPTSYKANADVAPAFSKDFNVDSLDLGLPQRNPMDFMGSFAPKEAPPIDMSDPFGSKQQQNTEVQSPILRSDSSNPNDAHSQFMQRYLEQSANNAMGMQGMNAANSATAYNNMLEASIARGANSRSKGSYTPSYQRATAYTPQAMNFGSNQQTSNPYLGMFSGKGISIAPSKNTVYPQGMEISQNGKSLFGADRKLLPNPELSNQMKNYFGF